MSKGGGQGSFAQMQEPGMSMDMGGFGGGVDYLGGSSSFNESFNPGPYEDTITPLTQPIQMEEPVPLQVSGPARPDPLDGINLNRFSGGLGSKGGRSNPYQTDGIVPPTMRGQPLPSFRQFDPIDQPIARPDPAPRRTSRFTDAEHSAEN